MPSSLPTSRGSAAEVLWVFLRLGLTSFGGPIAHLGYFRDEFVTRRKWLNDVAFADLVALCQFLPGPASSQVGFALGLMRSGPLGALAAFVGFTLPSAIALIIFASLAVHLNTPLAAGALAGLKIVAVAIVAQAVSGMSRSLCPDKTRAGLALLSVVILAFAPAPYAMPGAILMGALIGLGLGNGEMTSPTPLPFDIPRSVSVFCLAGFAALLIGLPLVAGTTPGLALFDSFYRAGALVFGGGHVVLPLLESELVPQWVSHDAFLSGYGATQAVPGPLFTFAAYLGATTSGWAGAGIALVAVFAPGFLLLIGVLPFWNALRSRAWAQSAMQGANAAVVGVLGAALYAPVFTSSVGDMKDLSLALLCFLMLTMWRIPPWGVVLTGVAGGILLSL